VAAALQDYGRAVIVGAPSTFGKGTVQTLVDLDGNLRPEFTALRPMGTLKLTIQKFYRINGGATQYKGVVPDIVLPDVYGDEAVGEKTLDHPLPWDTVASLSYQPWDHAAAIDRAMLKCRSSARVDSSAVFRVIRRNIVRLQKLKTENRQTLNLSAAWQEQQHTGAEADSLEALEKRVVALSAQVLAVDAAEIRDIPDKQEKIKDWLDQLKQDAYIEEALRILEDMK
jgi:carboxyl-terminal processing protease